MMKLLLVGTALSFLFVSNAMANLAPVPARQISRKLART